MEDEIQESLNSKPFLPLGVALVGVVIGAAGLFVAINAASRASTIEETYKNGLEKTASITIEMEKINRSMEALEARLKDVNEVKPQIEALRRETQSAVSGLNNYIKTNRELIDQNKKAILEVRTAPAPASRAVTASAPATTQSAAAAADTASSSDGKKHSVKAGENFSIIAKKYGKSAADIEKANPGVDSRRLQIGQEINIP